MVMMSHQSSGRPSGNVQILERITFSWGHRGPRPSQEAQEQNKEQHIREHRGGGLQGVGGAS